MPGLPLTCFLVGAQLSSASGDDAGNNSYTSVFESGLTHQREASVLILDRPYLSFSCRGGNLSDLEFPRVKAI